MSRQNTLPQSENSLGSSTLMSNLSSSGLNSSTFRDDRFKTPWSEINEHVVGPMPADDFLQRFLRRDASPVGLKAPSVPTESLNAYVDAEHKNKYITFITALQSICSNLDFKDTHDTPLTDFQQFVIKPEICVVNRGVNPVQITNAEILIELKPEHSQDPFEDKGELMEDNVIKKYFVEETETGQDMVGQTTVYAAAQQSAQFRTHIFSVLVIQNDGRLMRWDRSGVIVTEKISIFSPFFVEFFHLYDHAAISTRGIDISVSDPTRLNAVEARKSLGIHSTSPLVQLSLSSAVDDSYIVSRNTYMNKTYSPLGRSTRTFIAYSISRQCNYFLKDSWRLESQTPEHEIYDSLHSHNVPHISTVVGGKDVLNQNTLAQDIVEENPDWIRAPPKGLRKHKHYRLVLKEIATPLISFSSTKLLVTAVRDAIEAHRVAYFDAGVLHRDISAGNIMIYKNGGLLLDWDLSKRNDEKGAQGRTGTWQFISARLLKEPNAVQGYIDDVESFVHVITWISFRYARHDLKYSNLEHFMARVFDESYYDYDNGVTMGGDSKVGYLASLTPLKRTTFESINLKNLLEKITEVISIRYVEGAGKPELLKAYLVSYAKRLAILEDSMWIISEFTSALSLPNWPAGDKAR